LAQIASFSSWIGPRRESARVTARRARGERAPRARARAAPAAHLGFDVVLAEVGDVRAHLEALLLGEVSELRRRVEAARVREHDARLARVGRAELRLGEARERAARWSRGAQELG